MKKLAFIFGNQNKICFFAKQIKNKTKTESLKWI